jgi:hypothetical protein
VAATIPARWVDQSHHCRHPRHRHQLLLLTAAATTPLLPLPSTATAVNNAAIGTIFSIPPPPPSMTTSVDKGGSGTLASAITIAAASADVTALRLWRSCQWLVVVSSVAPCLLCCQLSEFVSPRRCAIVDAFAAGPPSPFAYHCQPLSCCSFTKHQLLLPLQLMVGCCILCPPSSIPTISPS